MTIRYFKEQFSSFPTIASVAEFKCYACMHGFIKAFIKAPLEKPSNALCLYAYLTVLNTRVFIYPDDYVEVDNYTNRESPRKMHDELILISRS